MFFNMRACSDGLKHTCTYDNTRRQKISNESRLVPALVYQVELLEAHLIRIQKTQANGKSLDLMRHFKRSTARDFKIDYGVLQKVWPPCAPYALAFSLFSNACVCAAAQLAKDDDEDGNEEGKKKAKVR